MDDLRPPQGHERNTSRELRALLRAALEAIPSAAFVLDLDGALLDANVAGRRWLAHDSTRETLLREAVRGRPPADLVVSRVPDGVAAFLLLHREHAERGERRTGSGNWRSERESLEASTTLWKLTPRERDILALLLDGASNRAIAASLSIAERTVETHLTSMFEKAGVRSRAELVARVRRSARAPT